MHRYLNAHVSNYGNKDTLPDVVHHHGSAPRHTLDAVHRLNMMVDIAVVRSDQRKKKFLKESYVVYLIESRPFAGTTDQRQCVWRRYKEFEILRYNLATTYPYAVMPPLPEKRTNVTHFRFAWNKFDPDFIERRRERLGCFISKLASHPTISEDPVFQGFLHEDNEVWSDVLASHWKQKLDNTIKTVTMNISMGIFTLSVRRPEGDRMKRIRLYSGSLEGNIGNIIKIHGRISSKTMCIAKQHLEYGKIFRLWLSMEKDKEGIGNRLSDLLDLFSNQTATALHEEQSIFVGTLKDYSLYVHSLSTVIWNQDSYKHQLVQEEKRLVDMKRERDQLKNDIAVLEQQVYPPVPPSNSLRSSVRSKLQGPQSVEKKQEKMLALETDIKKNDGGPESSSRKTKAFEEKTLEEFERFEGEKFEEIHEMVMGYVKTQLKMNEAGLTQWKLMREYFINL